MINAKEAKELYDQCGQEVTDYLKHTVEKEVVKAAEGGKRQVTIFLNAKRPFDHLCDVIKPLEKSVVDKLNELGYSAKINLYGDCYVPSALTGLNGDGPYYQNYGIQISW